MAFLVSQLRKNESQQYMIDVPVEPDIITSPNTFGDTTEEGRFIDFALKATSTEGFSPEKVYYLRFRIHKIPKYFYSGSRTSSQVHLYVHDADDLKLQILLKNGADIGDEQNDPPEIIGTCYVPVAMQTESEEYSSYSFVFTPSKTFDRIGFRINRVSYDAIAGSRNWLIEQEKIKDTDEKIINQDGTITISGERFRGQEESTLIETTGARIEYPISGSTKEIQADVCELVNLVTESSGWFKFGYQSRPGNLIVVNGEPIRIGRSGIYEINNGTTIEKFMIASPGGSNNSKIDAFLLDYAYKRK